jgi:hypothetical protein
LVCGAFLYPLPVAVLRAYYVRSSSWPNSPEVMYFWTSISPIASLVLFGLMTRATHSQNLPYSARKPYGFTPSRPRTAG